MIPGDRTYLAELDRGQIEVVRSWINDPDVHRWMLSGHIPVTAEDELAFFERMGSSQTDHVFQIHIRESGRHIGMCGLEAVNPIDRDAELGVMIGDVSEQGKGYGRDAIVTLLRFGFETLGLHCVRIRAVSGNERGIGLYRSIGFRDAGVLRESRFVFGRFWDVACFDMLADEFAERYGRST